MKTWISDNFPLKELECPYMDICSDYEAKGCEYTSQCELREWFREVILPRISRKNLEMQVKLIAEELKKQVENIEYKYLKMVKNI